jgi:hypothetical protein
VLNNEKNIILRLGLTRGRSKKYIFVFLLLPRPQLNSGSFIIRVTRLADFSPIGRLLKVDGDF